MVIVVGAPPFTWMSLPRAVRPVATVDPGGDVAGVAVGVLRVPLTKAVPSEPTGPSGGGADGQIAVATSCQVKKAIPAQRRALNKFLFSIQVGR